MTIQQSLNQFHDVLDRIAQQTRFVSAATKLRIHSKNVIRRDDLQNDTREIVDKFLAAKVGSAEHIYEALYVSICFHFEEFIRNTHRRAVEEINVKYPNIQQIKQQLLHNHVVASGTIMSRFLSDPRASKLNMNEIAANVGGCISESQSYKFNSEVFSFFIRGASVEDITRLFAKIGLEFDWDGFGREVPLIEFFKGGKPREIGKLSKKYIDDFIDERNRIVHRGGGYRQITDQMIFSTINFFMPFSIVLSSRISKFCANYLK